MLKLSLMLPVLAHRRKLLEDPGVKLGNVWYSKRSEIELGRAFGLCEWNVNICHVILVEMQRKILKLYTHKSIIECNNWTT